MNHNQKMKTRIPVPAHAVNPLAKAMEKKGPKLKPTKKSQPETWYDEEVESVSQKQQFQSKTEIEKRKEALYNQLKKTEEELLSMQGLLDKREKLIKEADEEGEPQKENETSGASNNGDAGDGSGQSEKVEKITKKTMKNMRERMHEVRDKLHRMNRDTDSYLADIENTMQYLESLETASGRLGPLSEETRRLFGGVDDEEIIAKIYKENDLSESKDSKGSSRNEKDKNKNNPDEDESEEEVEEKPCAESDPKAKFFLTERTGTSTNPVQKPEDPVAVEDIESGCDDDTNDD